MSIAVVGCVEELSQSPHTLSLVHDTFETNFFANVNIIKAVLPVMRSRKNGHVIMLTGISALPSISFPPPHPPSPQHSHFHISRYLVLIVDGSLCIAGHLGTPGLSMYCSSQWAIEGYCDSLAYEIAPFNIKMSILQSNIEINILTNRLTSVPPLPQYTQEENPAPLARDIFSGLLDKIDRLNNPGSYGGREGGEGGGDGGEEGEGMSVDGRSSNAETSSSRGGQEIDIADMDPDIEHPPSTGDLLSSPTVTSLYAPLPASLRSNLIAETVHALTAIGGHDNPPARHIVGFEGVTSVKEKLKTVSEELEDFIEVSNAVDIGREDGGQGMAMDTGS